MRSRMPSPRLALAVLAGAALCGCGSSGPPPEVVVTVTAAPSAGPSTPASSAPPTPSAPPEEPEPESEVAGRSFDFGVVVGARRAGETDVLVLDRWTDPGIDDDRLAREGLPVGPWALGSDRYVNQNTEVTFDVPVREGATFVLNQCIAWGEPLRTSSVGATELAEAPEEDRLVLLRLDDEGWATGGETFAGC